MWGTRQIPNRFAYRQVLSSETTEKLVIVCRIFFFCFCFEIWFFSAFLLMIWKYLLWFLAEDFCEKLSVWWWTIFLSSVTFRDLNRYTSLFSKAVLFTKVSYMVCLDQFKNYSYGIGILETELLYFIYSNLELLLESMSVRLELYLTKCISSIIPRWQRELYNFSAE